MQRTEKVYEFIIIITPKMTLGDILILSNDTNGFNGTYKVISDNMTFGANYEKDMKLIKVSDSLVYNSDGIWNVDDDGGKWIV